MFKTKIRYEDVSPKFFHSGKPVVTFRHMSNLWDEYVKYKRDVYSIACSDNALSQNSYNIWIEYEGKHVTIHFWKARFDSIGLKTSKRIVKRFSIDSPISYMRKVMPLKLIFVIMNFSR